MTQVTSLYGLKIVAYGGGGAISFIDGVTGEVAKVKLADGYHDLTNYQPLLAAFDCVIDSCIVNNVAIGTHRLFDQRSDDFGNTAAVATYTPSEAVRFQRAVEDVARRVAMDISAKAEVRLQRAQRAASDLVNDVSSGPLDQSSVEKRQLAQQPVVEDAQLSQQPQVVAE